MIFNATCKNSFCFESLMYDDLPFYLAIGSMLYRKLLNKCRGAYLFSGALGGAYLEGGAYLGKGPYF